MGSAPQRDGLRRLLLGFACALASVASAGSWIAGFGTGAASAAPLTWSPSPATHLSAKGPLRLSCASSALCVAVDAEGDAFVSSDPSTATASWARLAIDPGHELTGVSCPSTSLCVAVDNAGNALRSTEPTTGKWTSLPIDSSHALTSISCPTSTLCVAVDNAGNALTSTEPAASKAWTSLPIDGSTALTAISCASAALCVAVDEDGNALTSTEPAGSKAWPSQPIAYGGTPLLAISCEASGACTALDESGYALSSADPAQSSGPFSAPIWSATRIDASAPLSGISCIPGLCTAIDTAGNALTSEGPTAPPGQWSPSTVGIAAGASLDGIACIPASACIAVAVDAGDLQVLVAAVPQPQTPPPTETPPSLPNFDPTLSGTPAVGQTLTCEPNLATGSTATISYQWMANTKAISGAINPKLKLKGKFEGDHVQCTVTATNAAGSVKKTTNYVSIPREFVPAAVGETKVSKATAGKSGVSFTVECSSRAVGSCTIEAKLSVFERLRGSKVVAVSARRPKVGAHAATASAKTRERTLTATIGSLKLQIKPGHDRKMNVPLNAAGKKLLGQRRSVPAKLTITGTVIGVLRSKLSEARLTLRASAKTASSSGRARSSRRHAQS